MQSAFLNWYIIPENLSPREAENAVNAAKMSGADKIAVFHEKDVDPFCAKYREKLLALFRAALRHNVKIYLSDDCFPYSGTAFGALSSVPDLWAKEVCEIDKKDLKDGEIPIWEEGEKCAVARPVPPKDEYPYRHYPNLLNPLSVEMIKENLYKRFIREYKKFAGYEFAGFIAARPCFAPPSDDVTPYHESIKKYDIKGILEGGEEREKYLAHLSRTLEDEYLMPLKAFCESYSMELCAIPCEKGASENFAENESAVFIADKGKNLPNAYIFAENFSDFSEALTRERPIALKLDGKSAGEKVISELRKNCEKLRKTAKILRTFGESGQIELEGGQSYVLVNNSDEYLTLDITSDAERVIIDPEKDDAAYRFKSGGYVFSPRAFLFVLSSEPDMFTEELPIRVGAVRTKPIDGGGREVSFEENDGGITFTLPDFDLSGKALEFEGDFSALTVKLGRVKIELISPPYCVPLFEFYGGYTASAQAGAGRVRAVRIV